MNDRTPPVRADDRAQRLLRATRMINKSPVSDSGPARKRATDGVTTVLTDGLYTTDSDADPP